ncbi:MAG: type IV secretory system conjugative DNA transfer family protein [Clostridia bacterium]|nr:type IV secretory system conjugative DNA transfer family protein [Clostridia bacterium]
MSAKAKKLLILYLPYVILGLIATKLSQAWRLAAGADIGEKILNLVASLSVAFKSPLPSFHPTDLLIGFAVAAAIRLYVYCKARNAKKYRKNVEYGSARWGTREDIQPYINPDFQQNVILTQTEFLTMESRPKNPVTARNKNVIIIGGSGSGKTRFWLKPNLMQCHSSYVVTDPKGSILIECGNLLQKKKYRIKFFNTINFKKSMHYNPFAYIHTEKDILKLVNCLITNTKGDGKSGDDFWVKAETLLYCALIGYIHYEAPEDERNISLLIDLLNSMETREDDEDFQNPVDLMFEDLEMKEPHHFAVRQYKKFKLAAGKTAKSILISCGARLAVFDIEELREITSYDELELDTLGDEKTALFLIMSDTDASFNFLISMIYSQLFNLLCEKADDVYGGRLPVHVRCLIDECANIGQILNLEKLVATIRSREISACLVLQAQSQLKAIYKDNADTIIGNMDSLIFLGGKEKSTLKEMAETLGKETIDTFNTGESRGREVSHSLNYQKLGKELMSVDELAVMDGGMCILQLRGVRPFLSRKYDITKHPNYRYLSDADPRNAFNIERYLSTRLKLKASDTYETFEAKVGEEDEIDPDDPLDPAAIYGG